MGIFSRRREPLQVGSEPLTDFMSRWSAEPRSGALIEESADWQWIASHLEADEIRWARLHVRLSDPPPKSKSVKGLVFLTDRRLFVCPPDRTFAQPLADVTYAGPADDDTGRLRLIVQVPEGALNWHMMAERGEDFAQFYPTLLDRLEAVRSSSPRTD